MKKCTRYQIFSGLNTSTFIIVCHLCKADFRDRQKKKKHLANWGLLYEIINPPTHPVLPPQYQAMSPVCMASAGRGAERENNRAPI